MMIDIMCAILLGLLGVALLIVVIMLIQAAVMIHLSIKEEFKNSSDDDEE